MLRDLCDYVIVTVKEVIAYIRLLFIWLSYIVRVENTALASIYSPINPSVFESHFSTASCNSANTSSLVSFLVKVAESRHSTLNGFLFHDMFLQSEQTDFFPI